MTAPNIRTTRGVDVFLALKEQTNLYTPASLADLDEGDYLPFNSEGLSGRRQVVNSRAIRRQPMRKRANSANGTIEAGGSIEFTASQIVLDKVLALATHVAIGEDGVLNSKDVVDLASTAEKAAGVHRRVYTLLESGRLIPFTAFVGFGSLDGNGDYTRVFKGCKINTVTISARVNEYITIAVDIAGLSKTLVDGSHSPVYVADELEYAYFFDGAEVQIKAGDMAALGELPVETFELQINHNLDTNAYRLGSLERYALDEGVTEVTGSLQMKAGVGSIAGAKLNARSGINDDRAFVERLNLEAKYAELQVKFSDWTRMVANGRSLASSGTAGTVAGTRVLNFTGAVHNVRVGDYVFAGTTRVRVEKVSTTVDGDGKVTATVVEVSGLPALVADTDNPSPYALDLTVPSHLRINLPFIRVDEPEFQVREEGVITGTARFTAYDNFTVEHVCKL